MSEDFKDAMQVLMELKLDIPGLIHFFWCVSYQGFGGRAWWLTVNGLEGVIIKYVSARARLVKNMQRRSLVQKLVQANATTES